MHEEKERRGGPTGSGEYEVRPGDCLSSIAYRHGLTWQRIWNHPANAELKRIRGNPNILYPGDRLYVPEKESKNHSGASERKHRFVRKGVPETLNLTLRREGKPLAGEPFTLHIGARTHRGTTDAQGRVQVPIVPDAESATLILGQGAATQVYELRLGHVDPVTEVSGIQARLRNLGYDCGAVDGLLSEATIEALRAFQEAVGLQATGEIDDATRAALVREHGS